MASKVITVALLVCCIGIANAQRFNNNFPKWLTLPWGQTTPTNTPTTASRIRNNGRPTPPTKRFPFKGPSKGPFKLPESIRTPPTNPPRKKRNCKWTAWKSTGRCKKSGNTYRIKKERGQIPANNGGKKCVGSNTAYDHCDEIAYVASTFLDTIASQTRGGGSDPAGSHRRGLPLNKPGPPKRNPCTKPHTDAAGNIRMLGKPCETQKRRRRSADGNIEVYEEPLRETIRVKRQTTLSIKHRDILFLIDESGSVGPYNFKKEVRLAKAIVSSFCDAIKIGKQTTRVGIMGFDKQQHPKLNFDQLFERSQVISHMNNSVTYTKTLNGISSHGSTCLYDALEFTRTNMSSTARGARKGNSNVEQVVVLFTDGCATCRKKDDLPTLLKDIRIKFENENIPIISFFIGNITKCTTIMQGLADGAQCYQLFRALTWTELDAMSAHIEGRECMDSWQMGPPCPTE